MDIQRLIELNIEIEGALRVYGERGSADALAIARDKAQQLNELLCEQEEPEAEVCDEATPTVPFVVNAPQEPEQAPMDEPVDEGLTPTVTDPITVAPAAEPTIAPVYTPEPPVEPQAPAPLRRIPIRNYFTINDKYLFRREVFDGDEQAFEDTLDLFEAMHSFAEAEEYFYDDLALDRENQDVKAFMSIVQNYFKR
ncbi:MAG: hypothetical protein ACI4AM_02230 [Muribaculaceae bacterium]